MLYTRSLQKFCTYTAEGSHEGGQCDVSFISGREVLDNALWANEHVHSMYRQWIQSFVLIFNFQHDIDFVL